ncbi:MerR family transcriptional regulator [Ornithinibacillus scapharcae]|uniref:MerR family transcriptional regulator n=1 Tax=Ornithinibacillus scapharcae TaxID=1147159 RepID=UPI000225B8A5|nr:MerR family transcriptional regulator [Ornithinibacillus scapharcae]
MHLTIQNFSKRTGLSPSRLRFYDKKGVLVPSARLENGYRAYSIEQIYDAKMIDSLRQANIKIQEIKQFQEATFSERNLLLDGWKLELDKQLKVLTAARSYIRGLSPEEPPTIMLSKWEKPKSFIWEKFEVERKPHPFKDCFQITRKRLDEIGIQHSKEVYVRTERINGNKIIGEVGFEILDKHCMRGIVGLRYEELPPTIFAIKYDCNVEDSLLCFSYLQMVIRYGLRPEANKLERYTSMEGKTFDYLIPLIN